MSCPWDKGPPTDWNLCSHCQELASIQQVQIEQESDMKQPLHPLHEMLA